MKTNVFQKAIENRVPVSFLYGLKQIVLEPYFVTINENGNKVIYGREKKTNKIQVFEYNRIFNIRVLNYSQFSPIIPVMPSIN